MTQTLAPTETPSIVDVPVVPDSIDHLAADLLERAAQAYRTGAIKHCKNKYADAVGGYCYVGALNVHAAISPTTYPDLHAVVYRAVVASAQTLPPVGEPANCWNRWDTTVPAVGRVFDWNDHPERTVEEVIIRMSATAQRLRRGLDRQDPEGDR